MRVCFVFFFFQAEDGIRDIGVTGVQTCALPISGSAAAARAFGSSTSLKCGASAGAAQARGAGGGGVRLGRAEGGFERDDCAALGGVLKLEDVRAAVELSEPRARVRESDAAALRRARRLLYAAAVVPDLEPQRAALALRAHLYAARRRARRDAVAYRVLDDGLEYEVGHAAFERLRVNVEPSGEPVAEAYALDFEVAVQE